MTHYTSLLQTPCALREGFSSSLMECLLEGGLLQPAPQGHYADARLLSGLLFRAVPEKLVNHYSGDGTLDDSVGVSPMKAVGTVQFAPGLIGQAFKFNGTGALEGSGDATCWPCEENWTESFFAKFDSIDGEMTLLDRGGGPSSHWRHRIFKAKDNHLVLQVGEPAGRPRGGRHDRPP
jgi:hypothetical protein